jgi:Glu/Leu/Phe/Val dehydrogenase, dimerisation domain
MTVPVGGARRSAPRSRAPASKAACGSGPGLRAKRSGIGVHRPDHDHGAGAEDLATMGRRARPRVPWRGDGEALTDLVNPWPVDDLGPSAVHLLRLPARAEGIVVVDNVALGPAIGGVRMTSTVTPAKVARLARGMTIKNAVAGHPHGGAKTGIRVARPRTGGSNPRSSRMASRDTAVESVRARTARPTDPPETRPRALTRPSGWPYVRANEASQIVCGGRNVHSGQG